MNYSRITPEAGMVMKRPPVMILLSGRVPGERQNSPDLRLTMTAATELFVEYEASF